MTKPRPFGHYFILEKIAQGGMAEIFKGLTYDFSGLKKFIVIKRILPHIAANQEFINMLVQEAKMAVNLGHGNIAQTFDLGKVANDYFIVMEYVDGWTVSQIFKKATSLKQLIPVSIAIYIISEICHGLDYIHRKNDEDGYHLGIVHRDVSPQNVIVSPSGNVKIVDFGVAKAASRLSEREKGILKGKFAYMSPEQTEGQDVDARSDIFSTGIVLWEILTGRRLFKKKSNALTIDAVKNMTIYPPSAYRKDVGEDLDGIVMQILNRDPNKRYQAASDLSLALTKFLLKSYPGFKTSHISTYLGDVFEDEERTGDPYQEKTIREDITVLESHGTLLESSESAETETPEETMLVDPHELDFHSIFEEIDIDEMTDITRAISIQSEASLKDASSSDNLVSLSLEDSHAFDQGVPKSPLELPIQLQDECTTPQPNYPSRNPHKRIFMCLGLLCFILLIAVLLRYTIGR